MLNSHSKCNDTLNFYWSLFESKSESKVFQSLCEYGFLLCFKLITIYMLVYIFGGGIVCNVWSDSYFIDRKQYTSYGLVTIWFYRSFDIFFFYVTYCFFLFHPGKISSYSSENGKCPTVSDAPTDLLCVSILYPMYSQYHLSNSQFMTDSTVTFLSL